MIHGLRSWASGHAPSAWAMGMWHVACGTWHGHPAHPRTCTRCARAHRRYLEAIQSYEEALQSEPGAPALLVGRRQSAFALAIEPE